MVPSSISLSYTQQTCTAVHVIQLKNSMLALGIKLPAMVAKQR